MTIMINYLQLKLENIFKIKIKLVIMSIYIWNSNGWILIMIYFGLNQQL